MADKIPVDPQQLEQLVVKAAAFRDQGDQQFIETALADVAPDGRESYREQLRDHFDADSSQTFDTVLTGDATDSPPAPPLSDRTQIHQPAFRGKNEGGSKKDRHPDLPTKIGKFQISRELGRGAFGVVYQGYDKELERKVAIKVSLVKSRKWQSRLRTEAAKLAKTESTGIVPVYDIGTTDEGAVYVVQKFIDGCTLRELIKTRPLSPARAARLIRAIAIGLEPAHRHEILHRDLKPDNILLDESGKPWIADFGLAISEQEQFAKGREVAGTPLYMSPEQIKGRVDFLDPRSDIWALGVMLYEVLTNKLPFNGKSTKALTDQICELDPRPLHQRAPGVLSEELNEIFKRCCAKQPADRFATVRELADALDELIAGGLGERNILGEVVPLSIADSAIMDNGSSIGELIRSKAHAGSTEVESKRLELAAPELVTRDSATESWSLASRVGAFMAAVTLSILGSVAVIQYLRRDPTTVSVPMPVTPPAKDVSVVEQEVTEPVVVPFDADGSAEKPWVVAADGTGSHTTINTAVNDSSPGAHIRLTPGTYDEAIRFLHAVTITGVPTEKGGSADHLCVIENSSDSPVVTDTAQGIVTLRHVHVAGNGHQTTKEFNAIDVVQGTLALEHCSVTTSSFNCVKLRANARLDAHDSQFHDAREFAISTKDHAHLALTNCVFRHSGVQIVGGPGTIDGCRFFGKNGMYISGSQRVSIANSEFQDGVEYGVAVTTGGMVACQKNTFANCRYGIWVTANENPAADAKHASVDVSSSSFRECEVAINVQGGVVRANNRCRVDGGNIGIGVQSGDVHLVDMTISDSTHGVKATGDASIHLQRCTLQRCSATAVDMLSGRLEIQGGSIRQCTNGIALGDKKLWPERSAQGTISGLNIEFAGNQGAGIMAYSGPLEISDLTLTRGMFGVYAEGPKAEQMSNAPPTELTISDSTFNGQSDVCIVAIGDCRVSLARSPAQPSDQGRATLAREPAEIVEKNSPSP